MVLEYIEYFDKTWNDGRYKCKEWCLFGRVVRTNNLHERWNREFGRSLARKITLDQFMIALQKLEALATLRYEEIKNHKVLKKKNKLEKEKETQLFQLFALMRQNKISTYDYLSKIVELYDNIKHKRNKKKQKNKIKLNTNVDC